MSASYYWLPFRTATAQTGPCFFLYRRHSMRLNNQYWGMRYQVIWCGIETNKVCWMHSCSLASLLLLALADAIPYEKPYKSHFIFIFCPTFIRCSASSSVRKYLRHKFATNISSLVILPLASVNYYWSLGMLWPRYLWLWTNYLWCHHMSVLHSVHAMLFSSLHDCLVAVHISSSLTLHVVIMLCV